MNFTPCFKFSPLECSGENIANKIENGGTMSRHTNTMIKIVAVNLEKQLNEELGQPGSSYYYRLEVLE
jgi:hypothetical protein